MVRRSVIVSVVLLVAFAAGRARAGCHAEVFTIPPNPFVGQAVEYRVQILLPEDVDRVEWSRSPAFPHVRTERLPGNPKSLRVERHGAPHLVSEERRMLFVERAGSVPLESPDLLCALPSGAVRVSVPTATLSVREPPVAGVVTDVVGLVQLQLTVTPERVALGEAVRVALRIVGSGNVWDVTDPFAKAAWGDAEVFDKPSEIAIDRGRQLRVRKHFIADVVPRAEGRWQVPPFEVAFFDPETREVRTVTTSPRRIEVTPRPAAKPASTPRDAEVPAPAAADAAEPGWGLALLLSACGVLVLALYAWRRRARSESAVARAQAALASSGAADAEALGRILREALSDVVPDASSATPEELALRPGLPPAVGEAAALLESLERARFDPEAPTPDAASVQRALERL